MNRNIFGKTLVELGDRVGVEKYSNLLQYLGVKGIYFIYNHNFDYDCTPIVIERKSVTLRVTVMVKILPPNISTLEVVKNIANAIIPSISPFSLN